MAWLDQLIKTFTSEAGPALALGAFGKHPGWDDHIDDFGLETEALLAARQLLYVQGIGGLIDSGVWEKEAAGETAPPFGHLCFWFSGPDLLVARLWASQDRKGRSRYPMVVCAHASGVDARQALGQILPALEAIERDCHQAATAEAIHSLLESHRQSLRSLVTSLPASAGAAPPLLRSAVAAQMELSATNDSWQRIVYAAETQFAAFAAGKIPHTAKRISLKMNAFPALAQQMRLPLGSAAPAEAALFWQTFLTHLLDARVPLLFLHPLGLSWIDVIAGCPGMKQLVCLRASRQTIPLVQEVPYNLPDGFPEKAARLFHEFCKYPA